MRKKLEITEKELARFTGYLRREEREASTIEAYLRTARRFAAWLDGRVVTKELAAAWKAQLLEQGYRPVSVNAMLAAVNKLFACMGREDCKVRYLKLQRQMFRKSERELTRAEYQRLLDAAQARGDIRLLLLLETLCATGIRVSELQYITVEAAHSGVAEIALKGKIRAILLPTELCRKLLKYAKKCGVAHGQIFLTKKGNGLSRKFIWAEMKKLCEAAKVARSKVLPHNPCGVCSPGRSTPPAGTWCVWRMCWDTAVSRRPASTCCPRQKKVSASWTGLACSAGGHNYYFVQLVGNREMKTPHSKGCEAQMDITGKADSKHNESALHNCVKWLRLLDANY